MKKKLTAVALIVCMLAIMLVGASLAYFTDDEKVTNVMTAGNIDINLEEYMVTEEGKVKFESEKALTLFPMTDEQGMAMNANKVVEVYNDSDNDAYIRTIIAFEKMPNETEYKKIHYKTLQNNDYASSGIYGVDWENSYWGEVTIDSVSYDVHVFDTVDGAKIPAGAKVQSLQSVWLDKNVTNEDVKGLGEDGKMNIIVVAQGVQTENFADHDAAFAATFELTEENVIDWLTAADSAVINDAE